MGGVLLGRHEPTLTPGRIGSVEAGRPTTRRGLMERHKGVSRGKRKPLDTQQSNDPESDQGRLQRRPTRRGSNFSSEVGYGNHDFAPPSPQIVAGTDGRRRS